MNHKLIFSKSWHKNPKKKIKICRDGEAPKKKKSRGKKLPSNIAETRVVVVDIFGNKMTMEEAKKLLNTVVEKDGKFYKCVRIEDLPQNMKLKPK